MSTVSIVTADIRHVQGVTRYIEQIIGSYERFKDRGYTLKKLYSCDGVYDCANYTPPKRNQSGSSIAKEHLKKAFRNSKTFHALCVYKANHDISRQSILNYYADDDPADILLFQDCIAAYWFVKEHQAHNERIVITSHAEDDWIGQLLLNRPRLAHSMHEKIIRDMYDTAASEADCIVAICDSGRQYLSKRYSVPVVLIRNAVEDCKLQRIYPESWKLNKGRDKDLLECAIVATLSKRKGQDLLLTAMAEANKKEGLHFRAHFFGDGPMRDDLEKYSKLRGLDKYVFFHGIVEDIASQLANMDAFVFPSRKDTVPLSVIEAMRAGLPIFATNVGDIPLMVQQGVTGWVFSNDYQGIRCMVDAIAVYKEDYPRIGSNCRLEYERNYTLTRLINEYVDVFEGILA